MVDIIPTIFGTDDIPDYEALKRRRAIAAAIASRQRGFPKTLGEGLTYFGESLGEMIGDMRLRAMERAQKGHDTATRTGGPAEPNFAEDRPAGTPAPRTTTPPVTTTPPPATTPPAATSPFPDPQAPPGGWGAGADAAPAATPVVGTPNPVIHDQGAQAAPFADRFAASFDDTSAPIPPELSPAAQVANRFPDAAPQVATAPRPDVAALVPPAPELQNSLTNVAARPAIDPRSPRPGAVPQDPVTQQSALAPPTPLERPARTAALGPTAAPDGDPWGRYSRGLAGIESGGAKDPYRLLGAVTKSGDRAVGKYQVMGRNVPAWTEAALGVRMTPEQFRNSPKAQEATAKHRFMNYVSKYGPEGASRAWYAGEGGMKNLGATDIHGRLTVASYGKDFLRRIGEDGGGDTTQVAARTNGATPYRNVAVRPEADPRAEIAEIAALNPQVLAGQTPPGGPEMTAEGDAEPGTRQMITQALLGAQRPPQAQGDPARVRLASLDPMVGIGSARPISPMGAAGPPPAPIPAAPPAPAAVPVPSDAAAPVQVAQAQLQPGIRPDMIPGAFPSPRPAPPPADTSQGIQRAPDPLPSQEPIPLPGTGEVPKPGAPPPEPRPLARSQYEDYWTAVHNSPRSSDQLKAEAAQRVQAAQAARLKEDERRWQNYGHLRTRHEADVKASEEWERGGRSKALQEEADRRLKIERGQVETATARLEQRVKQADVNLREATVGGRPIDIQKAETDLAKAQKDLASVKPTEAEASSIAFLERAIPDMIYLDTKLDKGKALTSWLEYGKHQLPGGNALVSQEYRSAYNAQINWGAAFLTRVSGAAVSPTEAGRNLPAFLVQPGDTQQDIDEKSERRRTYSMGVMKGGGTVTKEMVDKENAKYLEKKGKPPQQPRAQTQEDKSALDWANANPNDPRAAEIKKRLGM